MANLTPQQIAALHLTPEQIAAMLPSDYDFFLRTGIFRTPACGDVCDTNIIPVELTPSELAPMSQIDLDLYLTTGHYRISPVETGQLTTLISQDEFTYLNGCGQFNVPPSSVTGVTNGLTLTNKSICLGGTLIAPTTICGNFPLTFCNNQANFVERCGFNVKATNNIVLDSQLESGGIIFKSQSGNTSTPSDFSNAVGILSNYNTTKGIIIYNNKPNANGIVYDNDYSSNYDLRSLVDKNYLDSVAIGLNVHEAALVATTGPISLSGLSLIDNIMVLTGDRILVKNQSDSIFNGIYSASTGVWNRTTDFNYSVAGDISNGDLIPVTSGDSNNNTIWAVTSPNPIVSGDSLNFTKFAAIIDVTGGNGIDVDINGEVHTINVDLLPTVSGLKFCNSQLSVNPLVAGSGLTWNSGVMNVNASQTPIVGNAVLVKLCTGCRLAIDSNDVAVNAVNGLNKSGSNIRLGGTITGTTTINGPQTLRINTCYINLTGSTGINISTGCGLITDTGSKGGLQYAGDYSANVVARSIPDAAWVTGKTSTSGIQTANNGLTKAGRNVRLGGTLTGNTTIDLNSKSLIYCNCVVGNVPFCTGTGFNSTVRSVVVQTGDSKIIVGGDFCTYSGISSCGIARLCSNGTYDSSFAIGTGFNSTVCSVVPQSDGKVIAAGSFTIYSGITSCRIARLCSNGKKDSSFVIGTGFNCTVTSLALQSDGKVIAGGNFTTYSGITSCRIARLCSNGKKDSSFVIGTGFNCTVCSLVVQSDGKIIVGGCFTTYSGITSCRIARLCSNGTYDSSFVIGTGFNSGINSLALQSDGKIIVGGFFSTYSGITSCRIARLCSNGKKDSSFVIGTGFNCICSLAVQTDNKIIVGGAFCTYNGNTSNRIARLCSNGTYDSSFVIGSGFSGNYVSSFAIQPDGKIIAGGYFTCYQGTVSVCGIARLNSDGSYDSTYSLIEDTIKFANNSLIASGATNGFDSYNAYKLSGETILSVPNRNFTCGNLSLGYKSLTNNSTGTNNTSMGYKSLSANTTGSNNNSLGFKAGYTNITGYSNTFVGVCAGYNSKGSNNIAIGNIAGTETALLNLSGQSNTIVLGNNSINCAVAKVAFATSSDVRDKTNIGIVPIGLGFVNNLNPISFQFKQSREVEVPNGSLRYGFKAQEILALEGENPVIISNSDPEHLKYNESNLIPVLVNAIKELKTDNETLANRLKTLNTENDNLDNRADVLIDLNNK